MRWTYLHKKIDSRTKQILFLFFAFCILLFSFSFAITTLRDALDRKVTVTPYPPKRLISLAPNITEILYAISAQDELIADTDYCNYPPKAKTKIKIGGFINPNLEKIVSLNPDLVILTADSNQNKIYSQLVQLKIPVFVINPDDMPSTFSTIRLLGKVTDRELKADKLVKSLQERVESIKKIMKNVDRPRVLFLWSEDPLITAGGNTFTDNLIQMAGGINIAHESNVKYPKFSTEEILEQKPQVIISCAMGNDKSKSALLERWKSWTDIPAIKNHRVYTIDPDLLARPAPSIVDGLETLAKAIHPELFGK